MKLVVSKNHLIRTKEPRPNQASCGREVAGSNNTCVVRIQLPSFLNKAWSTEPRSSVAEFSITLSDLNLSSFPASTVLETMSLPYEFAVRLIHHTFVSFCLSLPSVHQRNWPWGGNWFCSKGQHTCATPLRRTKPGSQRNRLFSVWMPIKASNLG